MPPSPNPPWLPRLTCGQQRPLEGGPAHPSSERALCLFEAVALPGCPSSAYLWLTLGPKFHSSGKRSQPTSAQDKPEPPSPTLPGQVEHVPGLAPRPFLLNVCSASTCHSCLAAVFVLGHQPHNLTAPEQTIHACSSPLLTQDPPPPVPPPTTHTYTLSLSSQASQQPPHPYPPGPAESSSDPRSSGTFS